MRVRYEEAKTVPRQWSHFVPMFEVFHDKTKLTKCKNVLYVNLVRK